MNSLFRFSKRVLAFSLFIFAVTLSSSKCNAQTTFWTETFTNGCTSLCNSFTGVNGAWTVTATGTNGAKANTWYWSCAENGNAAGTCGTGCGNDASMHVGNVPGSPAAAFFCPTGDCGAAYDATNAQVVTNKRAESPTINCTGKNNITISFNYIERGQGTSDNATLWYFDGTSWSQLIDLAKTPTGVGCGTQGFWTNYSQLLPASANNNANVKIGINWTNNGDGIGNDPSIAVDDITLSIPAGTAPVSAFTISDDAICPGSCVSFSDQSTNTPTSWSWTFNGGNPASSSSQNPGIVCFNSPGTYTITLLVSNAFGNNSSSQTITVFPNAVADAGFDWTVCAGTGVSLSASGGVSYSWALSTGLSATNISNPIATPSTTTTYTVTVTDGNGCTGSDNVIININPLPTVTINPSSYNLCKGQGVQLTASGASSYSWSPTIGLNASVGASVFANPGSSSTYTVTGTDVNGCKNEATSVITVSDAPLVAASITNANPCPGGGAINLTVIGGIQPYTFSWSNGATTQNLSNLIAGNYTVTVYAGPCSVINTYAIGAGTYAPTLSVTNLYSCSARLNWTATASVAFYYVRYKVTGTATWSTAVNVGNVLFYDFTGLAANTTYTFSVAAFCPGNQNLGWRSKNGKTQVCTAPINPVVTNLTNNSVTVSWSSACSPASFTFQYRKSGTTVWTSINTTATSATANNLVTATQYDFRVRSSCGTGVNSAFTAIQNFTTPRFEDTEPENQFAIFPNPNSGSFVLQIPALKNDGEISIYNITGQMIYHSLVLSNENSSSQKIILENISSGLYEVVITDGAETLKHRLIIQK